MKNNQNNRFDNALFICSKPLQFLNCVSIVRSYKINNAHMVVVTKGISDLEDFKKFISIVYDEAFFSSVLFVETHYEGVSSHKNIKYDNFFIEDDCVSLYYILNKIKRNKTIVFEEGVGTYLGHYRFMLKGMRYFRWLVSSVVFGCGLDFGEGRKTNHVMVRYPELFNKIKPNISHKTLPMPGHISELDIIKSRIVDLYFNEVNELAEKVKRKKIAIVLGMWGGMRPGDENKIARDEYDFILYKPHPHDGVPQRNFLTMETPSWLPAEFIVIFLANVADFLTVYHYGSSVSLYRNDLPENVKYICISDNQRYEIVIKYFESL